MKITIETGNEEFCEMLTKLICCSGKVGIGPQYKYDWENVPDEVMWIATDRCFNEGLVWGYTSEPIQEGSFWDVGYISPGDAKDYYSLSIKPYIGNWKDSLERRPKEFGG